jgi:hypothetical protein
VRLYGVTRWKTAGKTGLMERLVAGTPLGGSSVSRPKPIHHCADIHTGSPRVAEGAA